MHAETMKPAFCVDSILWFFGLVTSLDGLPLLIVPLHLLWQASKNAAAANVRLACMYFLPVGCLTWLLWCIL